MKLLSSLCIASFALLAACKQESKTMTAKPETNAKPALEELWVNRFLGLEIYHIETAEWNLYRDEEDGRMNLWVKLDCDKAIKQFEDTEYTNTIPNWEINLVEPEIVISEGFEAAVPEGYDESRGGWITNFYACSHDGSDKNTIQILKEEGDKLLIRLTGEIVDPNFYDDSKPRSKLLVETWFTKNTEGGRSMQ
jgi:hypothetical protein